MKKILVIILAMVFACSMAFASVGVKDQGVYASSAMDLDFTGNVDIVNPNTAVQEVKIGERIIEKDTYYLVQISDSGTAFIATGVESVGTASRTFRLPDITATTHDGVFYSFLNGTHTGDVAPELNIDPGEDDTIWLDATQTDDESIRSQVGSDSYPSITLRAFGGNWYIESIGHNGAVGQWTSGG